MWNIVFDVNSETVLAVTSHEQLWAWLPHFPVMALHYFRNFYFSVGTQCCVHPVLPLLQFFLQSCLCFVKCPQRFKNPCFMDLTFNKDRASSWYFNLLWSLKLQLMPWRNSICFMETDTIYVKLSFWGLVISVWTSWHLGIFLSVSYCLKYHLGF